MYSNAKLVMTSCVAAVLLAGCSQMHVPQLRMPDFQGALFETFSRGKSRADEIVYWDELDIRVPRIAKYVPFKNPQPIPKPHKDTLAQVAKVAEQGVSENEAPKKVVDMTDRELEMGKETASRAAVAWDLGAEAYRELGKNMMTTLEAADDFEVTIWGKGMSGPRGKVMAKKSFMSMPSPCRTLDVVIDAKGRRFGATVGACKKSEGWDLTSIPDQ